MFLFVCSQDIRLSFFEILNIALFAFRITFGHTFEAVWESRPYIDCKVIPYTNFKVIPYTNCKVIPYTNCKVIPYTNCKVIPFTN